MIKEFNIKIDTQEDFCESDLIEVIYEGLENVGNHTAKEIIINNRLSHKSNEISPKELNEFENLYQLYLIEWKKEHKEGEPVCYNEWVDNELEELRVAYRRYLKEAVIEDENFDETAVENFYEFSEEEINNPSWLE